MKGSILKLRRGNTNSLMDQNGYKYIDVNGYYYPDSSTFLDFECDKNESQKCMAKLRYNEIKMEVIFITSHSCRWSYEELPDYRKDNIYIKTGYHPTTITWSEKLHLLFTLHSETINIWSHMLGVFLFCGYLMDSLFNDDSKYYWVAILFDFAALMLFTASTAYHWLHICSESSCQIYTCVDFCGIPLYGHATYIAWVNHSSFRGYPIFYVCTIIQSISFAIGIFFSCRSVYYCVWGSPDWKFNERMRRGGCLAHLLGVQLTIFYQYHVGGISMECWIVGLIAYVTYDIGFTIYAVNIPEAIWPGKFDLYFNSHQIMHFMSLIATVLVRKFFDCMRVSK